MMAKRDMLPATPAHPRRAATVLVLRRGPDGDIQVLLVRRSRTASFMANSYVFPGGRVDDADYAGGEALASRCAAARELREEVGIELQRPEDMPFFSHWITPSAEPKRFDTDFFLAELPPGQEPRVDAQEVFDLLWLTPDEALARFAAGTLALPPPTMANLQDLRDLVQATAQRGAPNLLAEVLAKSRGRRPRPILPKVVADPQSGGIAIVLPWDPEYDSLPGEGEPLPQPPPAPPEAGHRASRCVLTPEGKWQSR